MKKTAKYVSRLLTRIAKFSVNSASAAYIHQPDVPQELLKK
jgi:cyclic lactone autoinducer peptide